MRIVVKGTNWLGDAVMSLPTLVSLRAMFPKAHIAMLTRRWLADLYRGCPAIDELLPYDTWMQGVRAAKKGAFDTALILPRSFSSAFMLFTARVKRRVGYRGEARGAMLTDAVERDRALLRIHRVHYYHHLLEKLGDPPAAKAPALALPDDERRWASAQLPGEGWLGVNPGATYGAAKQWFPDRFIEVIRRLKRRTVIVGGPGDAELGERVARETGALCIAGKTTVLQSAAAIARCSLFLTNDTGPMHVADAVGVPIVAVFGPTDWVATPPYGKGHAIVRHEIECAPCNKRVCPLKHHDCMKRISADDVYGACKRLA
jgi:heptosyltransferase-2